MSISGEGFPRSDYRRDSGARIDSCNVGPTSHAPNNLQTAPNRLGILTRRPGKQKRFLCSTRLLPPDSVSFNYRLQWLGCSFNPTRNIIYYFQYRCHLSIVMSLVYKQRTRNFLQLDLIELERQHPIFLSQQHRAQIKIQGPIGCLTHEGTNVNYFRNGLGIKRLCLSDPNRSESL